jgi:hypothetical protein
MPGIGVRSPDCFSKAAAASCNASATQLDMKAWHAMPQHQQGFLLVGAQALLQRCGCVDVYGF